MCTSRPVPQGAAGPDPPDAAHVNDPSFECGRHLFDSAGNAWWRPRCTFHVASCRSLRVRRTHTSGSVRLLHERTTVTILNPFCRHLPARIHVSAFSWTPRRRDGTRTMPHTMPTKRSPSRRRRKLLRVLGRAVSSPMTSPSHLLLGSQTLTLKECAVSGSYTCHRCVGTVGRLLAKLGLRTRAAATADDGHSSPVKSR